MQQNKESKYLFKKSTHQLLQKYLLAFWVSLLMSLGETEAWTISILLIRCEWRTWMWYISVFLGFLQFVPWFSHANLCVTNFLKWTLMFHKGKGALCVWIQVDNGVYEKGKFWSQRRCRLEHIGLNRPLKDCGLNFEREPTGGFGTE